MTNASFSSFLIHFVLWFKKNNNDALLSVRPRRDSKVFYDVSVWASFCPSGMQDFGFSAAYSVKIDERKLVCLRRHFQRPRHWNSAAAVNHPHLCFSRFRRRFVVVIFGPRVLFSVPRFFFFLFTAGHFAHKSCLFCLLLSSLRQQVCCQQKWGARH